MRQDSLNALFYSHFDGTLLAQDPPFHIVKTEKREEPASSIATDPGEKRTDIGVDCERKENGMRERAKHMTGVVTETSRKEASTCAFGDISRSLDELLGNFYGRDFVPYKEVMDDMGIPETTYECSTVTLKNGKRVYLSDPRLGFGPNGFGYYLMTYIETTDSI